MVIKKILFPCIAVFLAYQTISLGSYIALKNAVPFSLSQSLWLALLLNLFITGIFAFMGFAYPTHKLLPQDYYRVDNPKLLNKVFRLLGIRYFKTFLLFIFWGRKNNRKRYFNGSQSGLQDFDYQTRQSEFGHLASLAAILVASVILYSHATAALFVITTLINLLFNLYPVLLQRSHRLQIQRLQQIQARPRPRKSQPDFAALP